MVPVEIGDRTNVPDVVQDDVVLRALALFYLFMVILWLEIASLDVPEDKAVARGGQVS